MPVRYLSEDEIREARKGLPKDPNILLNDDEQMVEGQNVSKPSRYQELKQELEDSKRRQQSERDAAKGLADPMEYQASKLDATPEDLQTAANQRSIGQMANIASVGLDQATQFSDKKFDNSASRSINTDVSENYGKAMGARQVLADKLRARAEEQRTRPATEGGKYAAAEALDTKNITDRISNPIEVAGKQARANVDMRADDFGAATYDSKLSTSNLADDASMSKSRTEVDTEGDRLEKSKLGIVSDRLSNDGKRISNSIAGQTRDSGTIDLREKSSQFDPDSKVTTLVGRKLLSDIKDIASKETDFNKKADLQSFANEIADGGLSIASLKLIKDQYPQLNLGNINLQAKLEAKEAADKAKLGKGDKLEAKALDTINKQELAIQSADKMKGLMAPSMFTPGASWVQEARSKFKAGDPVYALAEAIAGNEQAEYMRMISGAAVNESELVRLKKFIPNMDDSYDVFMIKLENFRQYQVDSRKNALENYAKAGRNVGNFDAYQYDDAVKSETASTKPTSGVPEVGVVKGGYKFKGGNPNESKNWEKQ